MCMTWWITSRRKANTPEPPQPSMSGQPAERAVSGRTQLEIRTGPGLTYTVPQLVRLPLPGDRLGIYFRTNRVYGKCRIDVSALSGENRRLIQSFPKEYMTPGEMQRISLPGDRLKDQDCSALLLECREG